jgi:hypothetical protein
MLAALAIAAFAVIAAQLVLLAYVIHAREAAGLDARHFQEVAVDLRERLVKVMDDLKASEEAGDMLNAERARLADVVHTVEGQRDEALHELEGIPDQSGTAVAARIRSRLQDLSALSGPAATEGSHGGQAVHGQAPGAGAADMAKSKR